MHPNPLYRSNDEQTCLDFARDRGFGALAVNGGAGPLVAHVPFVLTPDGQGALLHLVRSNPIVRAPEGAAVIAVTGPDGYVSPDWYGIDDQVPTWNYVAVHLRGCLERLPDAALPGLLRALSDTFETRLTPKPVWTMDKMSDGAAARMMRQIVPFRLSIEDVQGTWKLNQNKPDTARAGVAQALPGGIGSDLDALARLMKGD